MQPASSTPEPANQPFYGGGAILHALDIAVKKEAQLIIILDFNVRTLATKYDKQIRNIRHYNAFLTVLERKKPATPKDNPL